MPLDIEQQKEILKMRLVDRMSMTDIAKQTGQFTETIRRFLTNIGAHVPKKLRPTEDCAKNVIHRLNPTVKHLFEKLTDGRLEKSYQRSTRMLKQKNWKGMTDEKKAEFNQKSRLATREASRIGSKLERYLVAQLTTVYPNVIPKAKNFLPETKVHVDILLPDEKIAIEVDGLMHYGAFYRDGDKRQMRDHKKNEDLLNAGYAVIRVVNEKEFATWYGQLLRDNLLLQIAEFRKKGVDRLASWERIAYITSGAEIYHNREELLEYLRERKLGPFREKAAD